MKRYIRAVLAAAAASLMLLACSASTPQDQLREIDELMNKGFPLTTEQKETVDQFLAEGKRLQEEGKNEESRKSLDQALAVLKLAQDAYIFNKAD